VVRPTAKYTNTLVRFMTDRSDIVAARVRRAVSLATVTAGSDARIAGFQGDEAL
jgi:hypothetical protein